MSVPIVSYVPAWLDACALYRLFLPHLHTPYSRFTFHRIRTPVEEMADASVIVVQRQCSQGNMLALRQMREMGLKVVYDLDDDLWSIPGSSPAKKIFEPVKAGFGACMHFCDCLTVSTEGLKTAVQTAVPVARTKPIHVIPNGIDFNYMRPSVLPKNKNKVVVGWGGSNTHAGDVGIAWSVLPELLEELPQLHLEFVGMYPPAKLINHERVRMREFVPVGEFSSRFASWGWDIVLAPLDSCRFNNSKSNIKMLEASAIGAPCLASDFGPYRNFCELSPDLGWLLCKTTSDWKNKIRELVLNEERRIEMAARMRRVAEEHFEQGKLISKWIEVFEGLVQ